MCLHYGIHLRFLTEKLVVVVKNVVFRCLDSYK